MSVKDAFGGGSPSKKPSKSPKELKPPKGDAEVAKLQKKNKRLEAEVRRLKGQLAKPKTVDVSAIEAEVDQLRAELQELRGVIQRSPTATPRVGSDALDAHIEYLHAHLDKVPPRHRRMVKSIYLYTGAKNNKYSAIGEGYRWVINDWLAQQFGQPTS